MRLVKKEMRDSRENILPILIGFLAEPRHKNHGKVLGFSL